MKRSIPVFILSLLFLSIMGSVSAQEDSLTIVCTVQEDWCIRMTEAFEASSGISTSFVRLSTGETVARLSATANDPEFSVWWGGPSDGYIAAMNEGLFEAYESPNAAMLDPGFIGEGNSWYGIYIGVLGFCSNQTILDELGVEAPHSWADLLNPALKGQIAQAHIATSGTGYTAFWTNVLLNAEKLEFPDGRPEGATVGSGTGYDETGQPSQSAIDMTFAYYTELLPNILQFTRSGSASGPMAGRGEIAVSIIFSHDCVKLQQEGFDEILTLSFPEEGTGYEMGGVALIANAPEPDAARMFIDFALSAEGQMTGQAVNSFQIPSNPETPIPDRAVDLASVHLVNYDAVIAGEFRSVLAERFDVEIAPRPES